MLRVLDLFSGIGGFSLGLERTRGFETVAFCEIEPFCQRVLRKHWPGVPVYSDVRMLRGYMFPNVDVITGGFPCQDISTAGRQKGIEAKRSGLWTDLCRLIGEVRPRYAIVENVSNLLSGPSEQRGGWFGKVLGDLAEVGYDAEWHCIQAADVGAPHLRDRIWIIAYPQYSNPNSAGPHRAQKHLNGSVEPGNKQVRFAGSLCEILANTQHGRLPERRGIEDVGGYGDGPERVSGDVQSCGRVQETKVLAHTTQLQCDGGDRESKRNFSKPRNRCGSNGICLIWPTEPNVGRVAHGVSGRSHRLRGLGNAIVPQIAEEIGKAIMKVYHG